jgi:hypothetical protein
VVMATVAMMAWVATMGVAQGTKEREGSE